MADKLKIVYCGNFQPPYSTENDVKKAFEYLGHEVISVQENQTSIEKIRKHLKSSDMFLITSTWDDALPLVGMIDLYKECAEAAIPTCTLHLDTFWGKSRGGRKWHLNPMFHTAYVFTADGDYEEEWRLFGKNHIWLPPAVRHDAAHFGEYKDEYACDVAFVGSNGQGYHPDVWGYRKELVDYLRAMCQRNGWTFRNPGGDEPKIDRGEDMNNFYASAKVTVGDSLCLKQKDSHYWSDRLAEATGRGGLLIMPQIDAAKKIYPDMPMYEWGNFPKLEGMIKVLLNDEDKRDNIKKSCQAITAKDHTYVNRVQQIIKEVGL